VAALTKKPIQVYLRPEQLDQLRALAERRKVSIAELVREGVDLLLAETSADHDPLLDIVGMFDSGLGDLAEKHDEYLAQSFREEQRIFQEEQARQG
jgi:methionine synthase I (cobalamin-dependent)